MPGFSNELWQAVKKKQYEDIIELIKKHPEEDLVNAADEDGDSLFRRIMFAKSRPMELIQFISNQPAFNLYHHSLDSPTSTNLKTILLSGLQVFTFFEKHPGIVWDGKTLSYELAKKSLGNATSSHQKEFNKNPESEKTKREAQRVADLQAIVLKLRDLTILQALETDNAKLVALLEKAEGKPTEALSDGSLPLQFLNAEKNPNLNAWVQAQEAKAAAVEVQAIAAPASVKLQPSLAAVQTPSKSSQGGFFAASKEVSEKKSPSPAPRPNPSPEEKAPEAAQSAASNFNLLLAKQREYNALRAEYLKAKAKALEEAHGETMEILNSIANG